MVGFPKHLNTKEDYEYVRTHFSKNEWEGHFQALLDGMNDWFFEKYLTDGEEGVTDSTHKVIEEGNADSEDKKKAQYIYRYNPTCTLATIGYTEAEVRAILA